MRFSSHHLFPSVRGSIALITGLSHLRQLGVGLPYAGSASPAHPAAATALLGVADDLAFEIRKQKERHDLKGKRCRLARLEGEAVPVSTLRVRRQFKAMVQGETFP